MKGIITTIDSNHSTYRIFGSITFALENVLNEKLVNIRSLSDLWTYNFDTLFIVDEHFGPHKDIWMNDKFIETCNLFNIKVIVFNLEKIYNSWFPHNLLIQDKLNLFKNLVQFITDIDDHEITNNKFPLFKTRISRNFRDIVTLNQCQKIEDRVLFVGSIYFNRKFLFDSLTQNGISIDIVSGNSGDFNDYMNLLNKYRFILCPLGSGSFLNPRVHEAMFVDSVPIVEYNSKMLNFYHDDLNKDRVILLNSGSLQVDMREFLPKGLEYSFWLEDYMKIMLENVL